MLRDVAARAISAIPGIQLPGGIPLIGDISPDVPPAFLCNLADGESEWQAGLEPGRRDKIRALADEVSPASPDKLAEDGWHRFGAHGWTALAYVPPDGWPPMPGHGHHDLGSFELHDGNTPVVVDPGRGSYADASYVSADRHSGLTVDGRSPTPENRPYYSPDFRRRIVPERPRVTRQRDGRTLQHSGFGRLRGAGAAEREWRFSEGKVEIVDRLEGKGRHRVCRRIFVAGDATPNGAAVRISAGDGAYRITADTPAALRQATRWTAYGESAAGYLIEFDRPHQFPYEGWILIERT